ncbi:MAG: TerB family tellurite resistance protein [Pseudomonadota bacterium]
MHLIVALLGAIATAVWILHRLAEMGISLAGLNPFLWKRRRDWSNRYNSNPIFQLESPLETMGLMMVAVAKADGEMSGSEREHLLRAFVDVFELNDKDAVGLLNSASHMYGRGDEIRDKLDAVLAPSKNAFSATQRQQIRPMLEAVAAADGESSASQRALIEQIGAAYAEAPKSTKGW